MASTTAAVPDPTPGAADYLAYAQSTDAAALDRALRACADRAYTQAHRHLGNATDADDAVQEAFLQLARDGRRFDGSVPFAVWVGRRVQVACLRLRRADQRRRRRERESLPMPPCSGPDDLAETVRALVARLPQADQAVIDLHYFAGLSQAEVATALDSSENAVALRLSRARGRLRALLGGSATAASVALLLAAQPAHAAPPAVLAGIGTLSATVAAGAALPATSIPLSLSQKGLLLMSLHPIAAATCAGLLLLSGLVPALLWGADPPAPAPKPVPAIAADPAWQGTARELLPFLDPAAPVQVAVDWEYLRRQAATTKPTSLLADPRAQPALAHIREQFRLWSTNGSRMPDWAALVARADGAVLTMNQPVPGNNEASCLVAELGETGATSLQSYCEGTLGKRSSPTQIGPFNCVQPQNTDDFLFGRAGSRWALTHPRLLQQRLDRRGVPPPIPPAPLWTQVTLADAIATLATLDRDGSDPLGLATWLGSGWRTARPTVSAALARAGEVWRTTIAVDGLAGLPLRPASPAIAGCLPEGALATLALGFEPERGAQVFATVCDDGTLRQLTQALAQTGVEPDRLRGWISGDLAVAVQPQAPIPSLTVVLGLRPGAAADVRLALTALAPRFALVAAPAQPTAIAGWDGTTPIGMLQVRLGQDRLVLSTGDATAFLANPARPTSDVLALDVDLPALARSYLPMLYAMVPAKPTYFDESSPLNDLVSGLVVIRSFGQDAAGKVPAPIDLDRWHSDDSIGTQTINGVTKQVDFGAKAIADVRAAWTQLIGRADLPMQTHVAVYIQPGLGGGHNPLLVLRTPTGWRLVTKRLRTIEDVPTVAALQRQLAGLILAAGTAAEQLQVCAIPDQPCFDRRWLPPPNVVADHLPRYHLRLQTTPTGLRAVEDGLPAGGLGAIFTTMMYSDTSMLGQLHGKARVQRHRPELEAKHQRAITALRRAHQTLSERKPDAEPLWDPSEMLAAAGVPLADLASLTGGVPPNADQVDALGFWRPSGWPHNHYQWLIPLETDGLYLEVAWWSEQGVQVTGTPRIKRRPATEAEIEEVMKGWRQHGGQPSPKRPEPMPEPAGKPSEF